MDHCRWAATISIATQPAPKLVQTTNSTPQKGRQAVSWPPPCPQLCYLPHQDLESSFPKSCCLISHLPTSPNIRSTKAGATCILSITESQYTAHSRCSINAC